jgi:hypothetical protein
MQRNFILTDLMKTGFDQDVKSFIESNTLVDQEFDITGQYYDLPLFDLDSYDRKFALIDCRYDNTSISYNHHHGSVLSPARIECVQKQNTLPYTNGGEMQVGGGGTVRENIGEHH